MSSLFHPIAEREEEKETISKKLRIKEMKELNFH